MDVILTIIFGLFFLVLFPLGELARIDLPNNIAVTGIDIGVVAIFGVWIISFMVRVRHSGLSRIFKSVILGSLRCRFGLSSRSNDQDDGKKLLKPISIFLGTCLLSLMVNIPHLKQNELFVAFLYLLRFAAYTSLYFVVRRVPSYIKKKLVFFMLLAGSFILMGGYIQFFFYPSLRNLYYLGWDVHLYRMFSSFLDPNFLGAFLVLFLLFLFAFTFSKNIKKSKFLYILSLILIIGTCVGIVLTYSRSAYIMCIVGIVTFFILQKPSKKIVYATIGLFIIAIVSYFGFTKYSEGTNLFRTTSSNARVATSQDALIIFQKNPILGVGFNAYRYVHPTHPLTCLPAGRSLSKGGEKPVIDHGGAGTDNSFLFVLATTGIIGFVAYIFLLWKICTVGKQYLGTTAFAPVIISSIIALSIDSFFINSLFYPLIMMWMWVLIGLEE